LFNKEKDVLHAIFKETILRNRRCASLSLSDLEKMTGIPRTSVHFQLNRLKRRKLITIDQTEKTNIICINIPYKEIYRG